jgi:anti-anti-sigma regulatory factor
MPRDSIRVERIAYLNQACVLVLAVTGDRSLASALAEATGSASQILVVDSIELDVMTEAATEALIDTLAQLQAQGRHLIVVNVPEAAVVALREAGVDVASTTDRVFVVDPDDHPDRDALAAAFIGPFALPT